MPNDTHYVAVTTNTSPLSTGAPRSNTLLYPDGLSAWITNRIPDMTLSAPPAPIETPSNATAPAPTRNTQTYHGAVDGNMVMVFYGGANYPDYEFSIENARDMARALSDAVARHALGLPNAERPQREVNPSRPPGACNCAECTDPYDEDDDY